MSYCDLALQFQNRKGVLKINKKRCNLVLDGFFHYRMPIDFEIKKIQSFTNPAIIIEGHNVMDDR